MKNISKILKISKPLHPLFITVAVLITLGALLELSTALFFKLAIDEATRAVSTGSKDLVPLAKILIIGFVVSIVGQLLLNTTNRLGDHFATKLRRFLTDYYFRKALGLSQSYFDGELSGKMVNQLNRGILSVTDFFNVATNFILTSILQSVFTIAILATYSVPTAFFMALIFPIYVYLTNFSTKKWAKFQEKRNHYEDISRGHLTESIVNIKLVKGFNSQKKEVDAVYGALTKVHELAEKQSWLYHTWDFARNSCLHVILGIVYFITFGNVYKGLITIGDAALILQLITQVRRPLFAMSFIISRIQEAETGSAEFFKVLDLKTVEPIEDVTHLEQFTHPDIKFEDVSFAYEGDKNVLSHVNLQFASRESVALVGKSGAGKSTIANLILKFYETTQGQIYMNGQSYKDLTPAKIRNNIALVFQENELFSTTIRDNVAYGRNYTEEQIIDALQKAQAWDFVQKLDKQLDTEVGERGVKLSGGQKQRIQIARAILKNSPILILDEATSSLDAKSEMLVQDALDVLMKDRLTIIIAHRFSTIRNVDKIVVIDDGRVTDCGTPAELATRPGIYSDLLKFQIEGNKKLLASYEIY